MRQDIENAKIRSTQLGCKSDHGILSCWIHVEGEGWGQGFGGYGLDGPWSEREQRRLDSTECGRWISGILDALELDTWEKLPGTIVRIRRSENTIVAIGHAYKDRWFHARKEVTE